MAWVKKVAALILGVIAACVIAAYVHGWINTVVYSVASYWSTRPLPLWVGFVPMVLSFVLGALVVWLVYGSAKKLTGSIKAGVTDVPRQMLTICTCPRWMPILMAVLAAVVGAAATVWPTAEWYATQDSFWNDFVKGVSDGQSLAWLVGFLHAFAGVGVGLEKFQSDVALSLSLAGFKTAYGVAVAVTLYGSLFVTRLIFAGRPDGVWRLSWFLNWVFMALVAPVAIIYIAYQLNLINEGTSFTRSILEAGFSFVPDQLWRVTATGSSTGLEWLKEQSVREGWFAFQGQLLQFANLVTLTIAGIMTIVNVVLLWLLPLLVGKVWSRFRSRKPQPKVAAPVASAAPVAPAGFLKARPTTPRPAAAVATTTPQQKPVLQGRKVGRRVRRVQ